MAPTKKTGAASREDGTTSKSAEIDIGTLDARSDATPPNAPTKIVVGHARELAGNVRALRTRLKQAKLTPADAARLEALAGLLETLETRWQTARRTASTGSVKKCRPVLLKGRNDLFGAIDAFVDAPAAAEALVEIGGVDDDDDLDADTVRLIALARTYAADLADTEITPAHVKSVEAALAAFRAARAGATATRGDDDDGATEASRQALSEAARTALEHRNRAFWALAALDMRVAKRARFAFRADEKRKKQFLAYVTEARHVQAAASKAAKGRDAKKSADGAAASRPGTTPRTNGAG